VKHGRRRAPSSGIREIPAIEQHGPRAALTYFSTTLGKNRRTTGLLRHEEPRAIGRWIEAACAAGLVRTSDDRYRTLSLTPLGRDVMTGRVPQIRLTVPTPRPVA
jgi:hypothetical protein